jgi:hexosaminidase
MPEANPTRGYMLDISRDKVPTVATVKRLATDLVGLGYNQLQLYTEHTFAYPGHEAVWGLASPYTPGEICELDQHCRTLGLELVPCINTMGHWERWLQHPEYFQYAECPYGWRRADGHGMAHGSTLTPSAESLRLLEALMQAYLPLFSSNKVNIGGDEPWELGMGRSRERCEQEGRLTVYLDFLRQIIALAKKHKPEVQFWGDSVLEAPELWSPPEPGTTALLWGYEAGHPFAAQIAQLARQGQRCILCPGTSTWNSLGGRLENALTNIAEAAQAAEAPNCDGLLLTDWGDHGHHQPAILSLPAILACAKSGWQSDAPAGWGEADGSADLLPPMQELGGLFRDFTIQPPNRLPLVQVLTRTHAGLDAVAESLPEPELARAAIRLESILRDFAEKQNPNLVAHREFSLVLHLLLHAIARVRASRTGWAEASRSLRNDFTRLIGEFEALWLERNRPGGLHESSARLRRALATYPTAPARRPAWPPSASAD